MDFVTITILSLNIIRSKCGKVNITYYCGTLLLKLLNCSFTNKEIDLLWLNWFFSFRTLFIIFSNGKLSSISLDTQNHRTYKGGNYGLVYAERVAVEVESQLIYAVAYPTNKSLRHLVTLDYNDTALNILHIVPSEYLFWHALDVFKDTVIWALHDDLFGNTTVYICKPSPTCNSENIEPLYSTKNVSKITVEKA